MFGFELPLHLVCNVALARQNLTYNKRQFVVGSTHVSLHESIQPRVKVPVTLELTESTGAAAEAATMDVANKC